MPRYAVAVNASPRHVVSARSVLGAIRIALPFIEEEDAESIDADVVKIEVRKIVPKPEPYPEPPF